MPEYITVTEIRAHLRCGKSAAYSIARHLPAYDIPGLRRRYRLSDLIDYLDSCCQAPGGTRSACLPVERRSPTDDLTPDELRVKAGF